MTRIEATDLLRIDMPPLAHAVELNTDLSPCNPRVSPPVKALPGTGAYSRFAQRIRRRYPAQLDLLPAGAPDLAGIALLYGTLRQSGNDAASALRITRQLVLERLLCLDCEENASLETVTFAMTWLAEFALDVACIEARSVLDDVHGAPLDGSGRRASLWIVGMGKLGAPSSMYQATLT